MLRQRMLVDEALESPFNMSQFKRLIAYMKPYKLKVALTIVLMITSSGMALLNPYLMSIAIDKMIGNKNLLGLGFIALALLGTNTVTAVTYHYRVKIMSTVGQCVLRSMRRDLFEHLQKLSFNFYDNRPAGKILVRVINDVNSLGDLLTNGVINVMVEIFVLIFTIVAMLLIHTQLALITLSTVPIMAIVIISLKNHIRKAWQSVRRKTSNLNGYLHESITGMKVTQSFTREKETRNVYDEVAGDIFTTWMHAIKLNNAFWPAIIFISAIGTSLIFFFGLRFVNMGTVTVGIVVAFLSYLGNFWGPITNLSNFYNSVLTAMASTERIFEIMDQKPDIKDSGAAVELPTIQGGVEFKDVSFYYDIEKPVLNHVSFSVEAGKTIALVGPTGAGKTTVVNLLSRFYDVIDGEITIDGYNVKDVTLDSLRKQLGIMPQDSFIFSGTIRDNIRYGRLDATDEEIVAAAKAVKAHDFIIDTEKGYDTEVNERGSRLSQGQKQLLALARAMLSDPRVLILDEATSSIDTKTELLVQAGMETLLRGRTSFVIAHRLSTIQKADTIMVINGGGVAEKGSHQELMQKKGMYYDLVMAQYKFLQVS